MGANALSPPQHESSVSSSRAAAASATPGLRVSRSGEAREQEADRVADVVTSRAASVDVSGGTGPAGPVAPSIGRMVARQPQFVLQREPEHEEPERSIDRHEEQESDTQPTADRQEQEEEPQRLVQRRAESKSRLRGGGTASLEQELAAEDGKGDSLDPSTRARMERGFGAGFGGVRVHTGGRAAELSRRLRAHAFTLGRNVFFNSGKYEPQSSRGTRLLAHELTHVVQQGAATQDVARRDPTGAGSTGPSARDQKPAGDPVPPGNVGVSEATSGSKVEAGAGDGAADSQNADRASSESSNETPTDDVDPAAERAAETGAKGAQDGGEAITDAPESAARPSAPRARGGVGAVGAYLKRTTAAVFAARGRAIGALAANEKRSTPAESKVAEAEQAVIAPSEEAMSRARASQVETVEQTPTPEPDEAAAKASFDAALSRAVPTTLEDMDEFKEDGRGRVVGEAVMGTVSAETAKVRTTYQEVDNPPPPEPAGKPEAMPALEEAPETPAIGAGTGVVGEVQAEHTDMSSFGRRSDDALTKEGISHEQLSMVDEGELAEAREHRSSIKKRTAGAPSEIKHLEAQRKAGVEAGLRKEEAETRATMRGRRRKGLLTAREDQSKTKSKIELARQEVTAKINGIYRAANEAVKTKLADLEQRALGAFDGAQKTATKVFEDNVKRRMNAFKDRRYGGWLTGSAKWLKDKLFGMDELPEVKEIFDSERATFVSSIDNSVKAITAESQQIVQICRDLVATARKDIEAYVAGLEPALSATGTDGLREVRGKLDALDKDITDQEKKLQAKLAERREAAIKAIDEKIEKMKEEMSGLLSKLGSLLLNAMVKFFTWALKKAGYSAEQLMGILNKGKAVLKAVVTNPIGFIKNLVSAVKLGINQFVTNIKPHLTGGLFSWLTGALADVPIRLPTTWNLRGIVDLVLQILGLTWDRIRAKLVKRVGERVVRVAETSVAIVNRLIVEGPIALWDMIKEKAAEIKRKVIDGVRNWVVVQLVKQAVVKLVSFLNPAGAIIQAIIAIYNTVMFFVENINRIIEFVKTVLNSIGEIAMGRLSAAAKSVEKAMASTIPIILAFLARLIGLSGIGNAVMKVIRRIRRPIDRIVDKVIDKVVAVARKLARRAASTAKAGAQKLGAFVFPKQTFRAGTASHTLFYRGKAPDAQLMVASEPIPIRTRLEKIQDDSNRVQVKRALRHVATLEKLEDEAGKIDERGRLSPAQRDTQKSAASQKMKVEFKALGAILAKIFPTGRGTRSNPYPIAWPKPAHSSYPSIKIGPRTTATIPQKTFNKGKAAVKELLTAKERKAWKPADIITLRPNHPTRLPGGRGEIGIKDPFRVQPGLTFQLPTTARGTTPGGGKINRRLGRFGVRPEDTGLDGDHVLEIQVGGVDTLANLWPLDAATNRAAGNLVANAKFVDGSKQVTMSSLKEKATSSKKRVWLQIVSTK